MPKFLENTLNKAAASKGLKGDAADRYVYGAMNNMGAMKGNKETAKGAAMQAKHDREKPKQTRISPAAADRIRAQADRMTKGKC